MNAKSSQLEITLLFSADELAQIEAFAALHGDSVAQFIHRAALLAAQIAPQKTPKTSSDASWMTDFLSGAADSETSAPDMFAIETSAPTKNSSQAVAVLPPLQEKTRTSLQNQSATKNRSTAGIASMLARGSGPVWDIRQALGKERVHGLGWTREQLAFVLKMSVVGVRKMEHLGKTPNKSLESRRNLLTLAQTLQNPTPEIAAFIEAETAQLAKLN